MLSCGEWRLCLCFTGPLVIHLMLQECRETYELEKLWTLRSYDEQFARIPQEKLPTDFIYDMNTIQTSVWSNKSFCEELCVRFIFYWRLHIRILLMLNPWCLKRTHLVTIYISNTKHFIHYMKSTLEIRDVRFWAGAVREDHTGLNAVWFISHEKFTDETELQINLIQEKLN